MTEAQAKDKLQVLFGGISDKAQASGFGDLISQACSAYQKSRKKEMDPMRKAILTNGMTQLQEKLVSKGTTVAQIKSAVSDISNINNPITLMYNLMSIIVPSFTYMEVLGVQPMPTKKSPIIYPEIDANTDRNGVTKGTPLLGSSNWLAQNNYSNGKIKDSGALAASTSQTFNLTQKPVVPGSVSLKIVQTISGEKTYIDLFDDGKGSLGVITGLVTASTINYETGVITVTLATAAATTDTYAVNYSYDISSLSPAQVVLKFTDKLITAESYKLRSTFNLEDYNTAKKVLKDFDIDKVLSINLAGYINKEISCGVFDDMLADADADFAWNATPAAGISWALHRLSALQVVIQASNDIRSNIKRCEGNKLVIGTDWANLIQTLGNDVWTPQKYSETPIGPYVCGRLLDRLDVVLNQDYPSAKAMMSYKKSDIDASSMGGVFIPLFFTNPIQMDTLDQVQGMATQFGYQKIFNNSIASLTYTAS